VQHADRFGAADRAAVAVAAPAHVDDRDVEVAYVAHQVDRLVAGRDLVDDEAVLDRLPDAQTDKWVAIDHKAVVALAQGASNRSLGAQADTVPSGPLRPILTQLREGAVERPGDLYYVEVEICGSCARRAGAGGGAAGANQRARRKERDP
jgi:hypothetical protein